MQQAMEGSVSVPGRRVQVADVESYATNSFRKFEETVRDLTELAHSREAVIDQLKGETEGAARQVFQLQKQLHEMQVEAASRTEEAEAERHNSIQMEQEVAELRGQVGALHADNMNLTAMLQGRAPSGGLHASASSNPQASFSASGDPANPLASSSNQPREAALEAALAAERERVADLEETLEAVNRDAEGRLASMRESVEHVRRQVMGSNRNSSSGIDSEESVLLRHENAMLKKRLQTVEDIMANGGSLPDHDGISS
mmetsp:Transcript_19746/g.47832  ORF Transcript_19746/g.47832 Transcript_19746/m.47832 type:complete len:258 (-) Transcript_19746:112-885(-)